MGIIKKYSWKIVLFTLAFLPLLDLFGKGFPLTHDGQDHIARIANFYQNLSEGIFIPRWAGSLNWGYGHPILMFLYPLPSYTASFFHALGFTFVDSVKLVFAFAFILSAYTMYLFVKELVDDEWAAVAGALLYTLAPYRFVDLYVRGAIGEHVAFIFPPLVFLFLLKLSKKQTPMLVTGGAASLAGLILAHNAISLMFIPLFFLYAIYLLFQTKQKKKVAFHFLIIALAGFGLSAFFWLPAFGEGKYTLRDIVTGGDEYASRFVQWKDFFWGVWSYGGTNELSKQIGLVQWVSVLVSTIAAYKLYQKKNKLWILVSTSFAIFWFTLFLMTPSANPIWHVITTLQKFQFPWRFLSVTTFLVALLGGVTYSITAKKYRIWVLGAIITVLMLANSGYWHAKGYLQKPEKFYSSVYDGTTDTGESAPIWSVRFMEKRPVAPMEIIYGKATVKQISRTSTKHVYQITVEEFSRFRENTLYFPGWDVSANGKHIIPQFQDPENRGLMTFVLSRGTYQVVIEFKETKLRQIADGISLVSLLFLGGYAILARRLIKKEKKK